MTGGTLDSSADDCSEEEDCGIHAYLGEPSCECGALDKLSTTASLLELGGISLVLQQGVMAWSLMSVTSGLA